VSEPHVARDPAEPVHPIDGAHAESLPRVALLVERLRQVRVQAHPARPAQGRGLAEEAGAHRERGAGARTIRVMAPGRGSWKRSITRSESFRMAPRLDRLVRGQAAFDRPTDIEPRLAWNRIRSHGPPRPARRPSCRSVEVRVVERRRAAGEEQLCEPTSVLTREASASTRVQAGYCAVSHSKSAAFWAAGKARSESGSGGGARSRGPAARSDPAGPGPRRRRRQLRPSARLGE